MRIFKCLFLQFLNVISISMEQFHSPSGLIRMIALIILWKQSFYFLIPHLYPSTLIVNSYRMKMFVIEERVFRGVDAP